jgi:hypothetical protein
MDNIRIETLLKDIDKPIAIVYYLFKILAEHGLHLKLSKLVFMQPQMNFLGVRINKDDVSIDPAKISGITDWLEELTTVKQVCAVLGVYSYHRIHIP